MIELSGVAKSFTLHNQGGAVIPVIERRRPERWRRANAWPSPARSGAGKSTLMRMIYGNYLAAAEGRIMVVRGCGRGQGGDAARDPRTCAATRWAHVSQFLRVVPRVPTPRRGGRAACWPLGMRRAAALETRRSTLLARLNIPRDGHWRPLARPPSPAASSSG